MPEPVNPPSIVVEDVGNLWNVWVKAGSVTDVIRLILRY